MRILLLCILLVGCGNTPEQHPVIDAFCEISTDTKILRVKHNNADNLSYYSINGNVVLPIPGHVSGKYHPIAAQYQLSRQLLQCHQQTQ